LGGCDLGVAADYEVAEESACGPFTLRVFVPFLAFRGPWR
jgi:hypothetical protein